MGQFTLRIKDQTFEIGTLSGSARLKILASNGSEFYFDPKSQKYFDSRGTGRYSPQANGIDSKTLLKLLLEIDSQRRRDLEKIAPEPAIPMHRAVLFDNGDFSYHVHLRPVISPEKGYALDITSQWKTALKPQEQQFRFRACLEREGLVQLRDLIERELAQ